MLVSMTYHVPLFFCVVLGLTLGHAIFSVYSSDGGGKITAGTTACCAEARDDADDTNESDRSNSLEREILRDSGTSTSPTESAGSAVVDLLRRRILTLIIISSINTKVFLERF